AGWARTGASIAGSSIMVSAKFPVKHMPMAPTPGPPHSWCASRASARSHCVTGLDWLAASALNSALTQARWKTAMPSSAPGTAPESQPPGDRRSRVARSVLVHPDFEFVEELLQVRSGLFRRSLAHEPPELRLLAFGLAGAPIFEPFLGRRKTRPSRNRRGNV